MNQEICRILDSFAHFGVKLGLESTQVLLEHLGNPHQQVSIIHVAGTNGKGSVCAYLSTILMKAGYRVGRYTSPHLVDWNERICINNQAISTASLLETIHKIQSTIHTYDLDATQFEVITAAAWLYFAAQQVDIAVIEVGLGGRLDATNVCDRPLASIITSIGRDHWQRLGDTLGAIASEKAGILKPYRPAIIGPVPPEAQTPIWQRIQELNCPSAWVSPAKSLGQDRFQYCSPTSEPMVVSGQRETLTGSEPFPPDVLSLGSFAEPQHTLTYTLKLKGSHQQINSALAIATVHRLQEQGWTITTDHIRLGLATTEWSGRLQWIKWNGQKILVDGAHNKAAAIPLRQYVDTLPQPIHWIIGMLETKDHEGVLKVLLKPGDCLSLVPIPEHHTASPKQLATIAQSCCSSLATCQVYDDLITVLNRASYHQTSAFTPHMHPSEHFEEPEKRGTIVLCGSLYLIGSVLRQLKLFHK